MDLIGEHLPGPIRRTGHTGIFISTTAPTLFGADKQTFGDNES